MTISYPGNDWIPLCLSGHGVDWAYMGETRFNDPFFWDTANRLAKKPFNQLFRPRTSMDELVARAAALPGLPLAGLVFHMSRCGSTLISRALTALPDTVVLSEPSPLDQLLRILHDGRHDRKAGIGWLRALVAALGQPRRDDDCRLFIKLDSWHMGWFDWLREAFPETPWIFVYRHPLEVMVSQRRQCGLTVLPGHVPESLLPEAHVDWPPYTPTGQAIRVLSMILSNATQAIQNEAHGHLIEYRELPEALWGSLATHFALNLSPTDIATMRAACTDDAKRPGQQFQADADGKRREADDTLRALVEESLMPAYLTLENIRTNQAAY